ncbi:MAG: hypothetical protein Q9227_005850 [Pyrenula ochraceoflavens]
MLALTVSADLNGVTNFQPTDTEPEPFYYTFKVQCTSCREVHDKWVSISRFENHEMSGSRGEANFVWKCKNCKRESSAQIRSAPSPYPLSSPPKRQNLLQFDCRGCEFVEFRPDGHWQAEGAKSGIKFTDIELDESGEWYDYDEKAGDEVGVTGVKWEIRRA